MEEKGISSPVKVLRDSDEVIIQLLSEGHIPKWARIDFQTTALLSAVELGDMDKVVRLVGDGTDVNARDWANGSTALHYAICDGRTEVALKLLKMGADVEAEDTGKARPLHYAASVGDVFIVNTLIAKGAYLTPRTQQGETPLHHAAEKGHKDIATALLDKCGDLKDEDDVGRTDMIEEKDVEGWTALMYAAAGGRTDVAVELLRRGASMNTSLVGLASSRGHKDTAEVLKSWEVGRQGLHDDDGT